MKQIGLACIIDDDRLFVYGLKKFMKIKQFCQNLLVFENGQAALKYLKPVMNDENALPEVILLDINMPVMDGWQFLDEFIKIKKDLSRPITIFMISSSIDASDLDRAKKYSEICSYMVKPIQEADLDKMMELVNAEG